MNISVIILTKNEENDLPGCLASVSWCNDIHVLDSQSTDATCEIACKAGATVTVRPFDGYASQRNFGFSLPFKNKWVLILDADERIPSDLMQEIDDFVSTASENIAAARMPRHDIWWGRWLKHAQISPLYIRLVRVGKVHYEREINEVLVVDGDIVDLCEHFDHYPFSKGINHWIYKHNIYSTMEAELVVSKSIICPSLMKALFDSDFNVRRVHQKAFFYKLPARPIVKFIYMVFVRMSFLDGVPGIRYAIIQSIYEYFIVLKTKELYSEENGVVNNQ
jgi:glycosyltransferase involved in cell wall biosynthesis